MYNYIERATIFQPIRDVGWAFDMGCSGDEYEQTVFTKNIFLKNYCRNPIKLMRGVQPAISRRVSRKHKNTPETTQKIKRQIRDMVLQDISGMSK